MSLSKTIAEKKEAIKKILFASEEVEPTVEETVEIELSEEEVGETVEVELAEVEAEDGTKLSIEGEIAEGSAVWALNEEGEKVAAEGEYKVGGSVITIAEGVIASVKEEEEGGEPEAEVEEEFNAEAALSERLTAIEAKLEAAFAAKLDSEITKVKEAFMASIEELGSEPAVEPLAFKKVNPFKTEKKNTRKKGLFGNK